METDMDKKTDNDISFSEQQINGIDNLDKIEDFYNFKNSDNYDYKIKNGLSKEIVEEISKRKNEPQWMLDIRVKAL